jgi:hypothetical protein
MKRLFLWLLWALVIVGVCVASDQLLLHFSMKSPITAAAQTFYKDFRGRVIQLVKKEDHRLEAVKESWPPPPLPPAVREKVAPLLQSEAKTGGYVYIDKEGGLHLTTRLDEVPQEYRATAKPLEK